MERLPCHDLKTHQPARRAWLLGLAALGLPGAVTGQPLSGTPTFAARRDRFQRLTLPVRLNGRGPFRFFVDTGANSAAIAADLLPQLGLESDTARTVHSVAGAETTPFVTIERVRTGRLTRKRLDFAVVDRSNLGADGLLGVDWVARQQLTLNYQTGELEIASSAPQPFVSTGYLTIPAAERDGLLHLVRGRLGPVAADVFIDSGSGFSFINAAAARALEAEGLITSSWKPVNVTGVTGQVLKGRQVVARSLGFGGLRLRNATLIEADVHVFRHWNTSARPAVLIGADVLGAFASVTLDYRDREVRFRLLQPPASARDQAFRGFA